MKTFCTVRPADSLTIIFLMFLMLVSLAFHDRIPHVKTLIFTYSLLLLAQLFLIRIGKQDAMTDPLITPLQKEGSGGMNGFMDLMRSIVFPVVCVLVIFDSLGRVVHHINPKDIDPLLIRLDYLIFTGYPTVMLESFQNPLVTDLLQLAYCSYYVLPISLGVILKLRGRDGEFDRTVFMILLCFYLSYVGYMLFPALGPRYTMHHLQSWDLKGLFLAEHVQSLLNRIEGIKRDAFPSGHTAVALVVSGLAYRFHKGFFYMTLPVVGMLIFSTVYCRYHYVVDVIAGVILAGITFFLGEKYYGYWEVRNNINY
jgi:membrane-associated phospholipid phosphatase